MLDTPRSSSASLHQARTVADLLPLAARQHPTSGLHFASGEQSHEAEFLSYPQLLERAQSILGGLQARRAGEPGAKVVLLLERPREFISAFWACLLGGYVPCPMAPIRNDPGRWEKHLAHVEALLAHPLFISSGDLFSELPDSVTRVDITELYGRPSQQPLHTAKASDAAILMLTSGSTGNSKAVELTHANLLTSLAGRAERQQLTGADTMFNWIAFDHVAALLESHMIAQYVGARQLHATPAAVLSEPLQFLRLIHQYRVTVAFAPNFLLGQINAALQSKEDAGRSPRLALELSCLRRIVTGGEANVVETGLRFLELLAPHGLAKDALWPAFGMTETCAASVYSHEFPQIDMNREFATVGLPISGMEIRVVDEHGGPLPQGATGELQLRGPLIFHRYYNNEAATQAAFTPDGWFRTGDLGCVENGRLRLVARSKDSIIVSGVNYFSHELEAELERIDGVQRSFVAAFPTRPKGADTEQLVVTCAVSIPWNEDDRLYQLVVAVRDATIMLWGFRPATILVLPLEAFPKTSLGKIQRSLMRKRFEAGEFAADMARMAELTARQAGAYVAPEGSTENAAAEIFSRVLGIELPALSATASFFELGGTSLDILKLTHALERRLGFKGGLPVVLQNPSVRQLARHIASKDKQAVREYDPIVPVQTTGKKPPLFCIHPGNGEIFSLVNLARYFANDRPFYAIRPPGFNEGEKYFETFNELLETYINAILKRQPQGPYAIAGYSFGCSVAFEMAKELEARGHEVAFLGCIDAIPRYEAKAVPFNMATGLALVTDLITMEQFKELNKELRPELPSDEVCKYVLTFASSQRLAELNMDLDRFSTWARVAHATERVLYSRANSGKVKTMTVFCGEGYLPRYQPEWASTEKWRKELRRWDEYVVKPKYIEVPGHHFTIMGPKHIAAFQAVLRREIDLAFEGR